MSKITILILSVLCLVRSVFSQGDKFESEVTSLLNEAQIASGFRDEFLTEWKGMNLKFEREVFLHSKGSDKPSRGYRELINIDFVDEQMFKYTRDVVAGAQNSVSLYYSGGGVYFTEDRDNRTLRITQYFRQSLYKMLPFSPFLYGPEKLIGFDVSTEGGDVAFVKRDGTLSIRAVGGGETNVEISSKNGAPLETWNGVLSGPVKDYAFTVTSFYSDGSKREVMRWKLIDFAPLSDDQLEKSAFIYKIKPGYTVSDFSQPKTVVFKSDDLLQDAE